MHKSGPVANDKNKLLLPELSRFFGLKRERDEVVGKRLKVEIKRDRGDKGSQKESSEIWKIYENTSGWGATIQDKKESNDSAFLSPLLSALHIIGFISWHFDNAHFSLPDKQYIFNLLFIRSD